MVFQFEHMGLDARSAASRDSLKPWSLLKLKAVMTRWQNDLEGQGWNSNLPHQPRPAAPGLALWR